MNTCKLGDSSCSTENSTKIYPLGDLIGSIELIDHMGGELAIVNDARVSFDNISTNFSEKDQKLLRYLIEHRHNSPLRSTIFKFRVKAPLSTSRQWYKHHVASNYVSSTDSWNEKSLRYTEVKDLQFYIPEPFRTQSKDNKQQSGDKSDYQSLALSMYKDSVNESFATYQWLRNINIAKEQARDILPACLYTSFIWTTSLEAILNFLSLRKGKGSQHEIKQYAIAVQELIKPIVPNVLEAYETFRGS